MWKLKKWIGVEEIINYLKIYLIMGCSSCGKKTNISGANKPHRSAASTPVKRRSVGGNGSPYGNPKIRMSFSNRNR